MYGLIYLVLLSLGLLAQLFAEPEKLLDGGVIILFHDVFGNKIFLIKSLQESERSARHFMSYLELATFSRFMMTNLSSMTDSQFSMN